MISIFALTSFAPKIFYAITAGLCLTVSFWSSADFKDTSFPFDKIFLTTDSEFATAKILVCSLGMVAVEGNAVILATGAKIFTTGSGVTAVFTALFWLLTVAKILLVLF